MVCMKTKANILVICSDEHHPLMSGFRGHHQVKTPNLDRLAARGTHFTRAYCNNPICVPSRMSFITGKYAHEINSYIIGSPLDPNEMTWARRLDQAGIRSTMFGKMDFCGDYQDGGFSDYKILRKRPAKDVPMKTPYLAKLDGAYRTDKPAHIIHSGSRTDEILDEGLRCGENNDEIGNYDHDRQVADWAVEYLSEKTPESDPWALYVGFLFPHWPFRVPEKYFNMYPPETIKIPNSWYEKDEDLHPATTHHRNQKILGHISKTIAEYHPNLAEKLKKQGVDKIDERTIQTAISAYFGMITCMDDMIGELLTTMEKQGVLDNTYIIYTSDHGESLGEHGLFYKQSPYEGSAGVPLIVAGPGVKAGQVINQPVSLIDLYPTIMDMAKIPCESDRKGYSWLPLLKGDTQPERPDYIYCDFYASNYKNSWHLLAGSKYKYTYYVGDRPSLFDMENDPEERNDLATNPEYKNILDDFETKLRSLVDPEKENRVSKEHLGLIDENGNDLTQTHACFEEGVKEK